MDEQIKSNLALEIAEKSLGLAILKAEKEALQGQLVELGEAKQSLENDNHYLQARVAELEALLDETTTPAQGGTQDEKLEG